MHFDKCLTKLLDAAARHSEDSGNPGDTLSDVKAMLKSAWDLMAVSQKRRFIESEAVTDVMTAGGRGKLTVESQLNIINTTVDNLGEVISLEGYEIKEGDFGFYWETEEMASEDFPDKDDAILAAHAHLTGTTK
ncbi:multidrug transporter [Novimethylophilus kurashikiensis]|uniref:Multidrug transporter n=1 Tax=Novimethylophilus kurashikiensis TaxID=1825523 RepID=A0A2R5FC27_9PROT|nr:hypothetical protein [Novimethylophilus kurashikiensis]GBG14483.1 multidrug transporter [Novimethylophilus kurashikiensis]